jgi:hypothetical protein
VVVDEKTVLNIILAADKVKNIDEVVVTGYTKQKKPTSPEQFPLLI